MMIQTVCIIVWTVLVTFFWGIVIILASFIIRNENFTHNLAKVWAKAILFAGRIRVTVTGYSNIDPGRSYIYMSNHQSNFDIPVLLAYLDTQFRYLAKAELFKIPIFGYAMKRAGYISIDRSNRKSAFESLKEAAKKIRNGASVLIFPEGTRSQDGNIRPFKKGGFALAVDSGVPVVPIVIHGTWSIMPKKGIRIKPGNVVIEILKPIETSDYTRKTRDDLMEKVGQAICRSFEKGRGKQR
ncbi:MAG TPA: 1-acyl-sn-glycerol-3-phosphate acyltransferase [Desulfobacterales bacterium]|nr:1-acyl-sn-glycerol-3-phosphate acyltransferase [Desulfobacterales bacterium]